VIRYALKLLIASGHVTVETRGQARIHKLPQRGQPWTRPDVSSVDIDEYGREIRQPRYRPHPLDSYWGLGIPGAGSYGPGYRTG